MMYVTISFKCALKKFTLNTEGISGVYLFECLSESDAIYGAKSGVGSVATHTYRISKIEIFERFAQSNQLISD